VVSCAASKPFGAFPDVELIASSDQMQVSRPPFALAQYLAIAAQVTTLLGRSPLLAFDRW
jgi:hypothetical protein